MDNLKYQVRRGLLPIRTALDDLSAASKQKVEKALRVLEWNPEPAEYHARKLEDGIFKIRVPVQDGEVSVVYEVLRASRNIQLIEIKDVSWFKRALGWVEGLLDTKP